MVFHCQGTGFEADDVIGTKKKQKKQALLPIWSSK